MQLKSFIDCKWKQKFLCQSKFWEHVSFQSACESFSHNSNAVSLSYILISLVCYWCKRVGMSEL